jgi:hypothetical protein
MRLSDRGVFAESVALQGVVSGWLILAGFAAVALAGLVRVLRRSRRRWWCCGSGVSLSGTRRTDSRLSSSSRRFSKTPYFWLEPYRVVLVLVGVARTGESAGSGWPPTGHAMPTCWWNWRSIEPSCPARLGHPATTARSASWSARWSGATDEWRPP